MVTLAPQYVQEGLRIRNTYLQLADEFDALLSDISLYEQDIARTVKLLDGLEHAELTNDARMRQLNVVVTELQRAHERARGAFKPHDDAMAQLRKDAVKLHELLRERYPGVRDEELAKALAAAYEAQ